MVARLADDIPTPDRDRMRIVPAEPKAKRETWKDWMPSPLAELKADLITRAELLEFLERADVKITERELRYWESLGVLPHPVLQFHSGSTQALYPRFHTQVVAAVTILREQGYALREMGPHTRALFKELEAQAYEAWEEKEEARRWQARVAEENGMKTLPEVPLYLLHALNRFATELNEAHGTDIESLHLLVRQSGNRSFSYYFPALKEGESPKE